MRRLPTAANYRRMLREASRNPSTRLPTPEPALSQQERRRLWTAVSITALPAHGVRLPAPSEPALSVPARRRLWTAVSITALPAHGVRLPAPSEPALSEQAAEGSGLLSALQLSLRTECACQPPPNQPSPYPRAEGSGLLGGITALSAHGVRLPASLRTRPSRPRVSPLPSQVPYPQAHLHHSEFPTFNSQFPTLPASFPV